MTHISDPNSSTLFTTAFKNIPEVFVSTPPPDKNVQHSHPCITRFSEIGHHFLASHNHWTKTTFQDTWRIQFCKGSGIMYVPLSQIFPPPLPQ